MALGAHKPGIWTFLQFAFLVGGVFPEGYYSSPFCGRSFLLFSHKSHDVKCTVCLESQDDSEHFAILYDTSRCHHPFSEVPRNCQSAVLVTRNFSLKVELVVVYPGVSGTLKNGGSDLLYFSMVTYMKGSKGYGFTACTDPGEL